MGLHKREWHPAVLRAFIAAGLQGIEGLADVFFFHGDEEYCFGVSIYLESGEPVGNERVAISIEPAIGTLTVNLVEIELAASCLHVRLHPGLRNWERVLLAIERLGLFTRTGETVGAGHEPIYAEIWRWNNPTPAHFEKLYNKHIVERTQRIAAKVERALVKNQGTL